MKKGLMGMMVIIILLCGGKMSFAYEDNPWSLSLYGGGGFPDDDQLDDVFAVGGRLLYAFNKNVELGIDISWQQYDDKLRGVTVGEVTHIPFYALLKLNMPLESASITPYLLGAVGFSYWSYDEKISTISADDDINFTAKAGAGAEFNATDNLALFIEGGYYYASYDLTGTVIGIPVSGEVDANSVFVNAGAKFNF